MSRLSHRAAPINRLAGNRLRRVPSKPAADADIAAARAPQREATKAVATGTMYEIRPALPTADRATESGTFPEKAQSGSRATKVDRRYSGGSSRMMVRGPGTKRTPIQLCAPRSKLPCPMPTPDQGPTTRGGRLTARVRQLRVDPQPKLLGRRRTADNDTPPDQGEQRRCGKRTMQLGSRRWERSCHQIPTSSRGTQSGR